MVFSLANGKKPVIIGSAEMGGLGMLEILMRAGCYVAIIILGYILRKKNFLPKETFGILSKIVINIALPAAIIASTSGKTIDATMLTISLLGMGGGILKIIQQMREFQNTGSITLVMPDHSCNRMSFHK